MASLKKSRNQDLSSVSHDEQSESVSNSCSRNSRSDDKICESFKKKDDTKNEVSSSQAHKNAEEIYRLAEKPPLITLLTLMIGPIVSQITGTLYGIINSIWISKKLGEVGLSAMATEITLEGIQRAFGFFLMISASTKISQLFGQQHFDEASQVVCDLLRMTLVCGAIVPAVILPAHGPMCKWFKASSQATKLGFDYILPLCACSIFTCINLCCQGFLQAEGRTLLIGMIDLISLVLACAGICPFCLYVLNAKTSSAAIATVLADGIPGICLTILYFRGKFGIKPKLNQLLKPFSKHSWPAMLVGLSQLVSNLSGCIPGIFIRNLIGLSCENEHMYDIAMSSFNVICRVYSIASCICIAVVTGFIPAASYAHASKNDKRFFKLSFHACWINLVWCCLVTILALTIPRQIASIFGSDPEYLDSAEPSLRNSNYAGVVRWIGFNSQGMLQSLQNGTLAMIVSVMSNFIGFLLFAYLLYYTNKHNVIRLMLLYSYTLIFGAVIGVALLAYPLYKLGKKSQNEENENKKRKGTNSDGPEENYMDDDNENDENNPFNNHDNSTFSTKDRNNTESQEALDNEIRNITEL